MMETRSSMESRPLDTLNEARGKNAIVELKNGKQLVGKLRSFDIHVNTVLEHCEEKTNSEISRKLGTVFIRGDTIVFISLA
ncbi:MAG TPA: LSm family protein [Candidatus Nanoarchaeia archaeon]|nr:LSm family protein [Candidatus Nanoarchaeia archaeon]